MVETHLKSNEKLFQSAIKSHREFDYVLEIVHIHRVDAHHTQHAKFVKLNMNFHSVRHENQSLWITNRIFRMIGTAHSSVMIGMLLNTNWHSSCAKPNSFGSECINTPLWMKIQTIPSDSCNWASASQTPSSPDICECIVLNILQFRTFVRFFLWTYC